MFRFKDLINDKIKLIDRIKYGILEAVDDNPDFLSDPDAITLYVTINTEKYHEQEIKNAQEELKVGGYQFNYSPESGFEIRLTRTQIK